MTKYLSSITKRRTAQKKMRIMFSLTQSAYEDLLRLSEQLPEDTASQIVCKALRFAVASDMTKPMNDYTATLRAQRKQPAPSADGVEIVDKKTWCEMFGGSSDGVNCAYNKYELMVNGQLVKNQRQFPLRMMPNTKDDFRKEILGGFATLSQAEEAYEKQVADADILPERVIKMPK